MNQNPRVRQSETFAFGAGGQQQGAHRSTLANANCSHVGTDELHRVIDRHAGGNRAARRVDININVLLRILSFEEEQLGDDQVGDLIVNWRTQKNDVVFQESRVDVERPFTA